MVAPQISPVLMTVRGAKICGAVTAIDSTLVPIAVRKLLVALAAMVLK